MKEKRFSCRTDARIYFSLLSLAQKPGPSLIYVLSKVEERMAFLKYLEGKFDCNFLMAAKSFPAAPVLRLAAKYLSGFDISNQNEYQLISKYPGERVISITSPNYNIEDFILKRSAKSNEKIIFTCDQLEQYRSLEKIDKPQSYLIRLNCDSFLPKRGPESRFGILTSNWKVLNSMFEESQHELLGFHFHNSCQSNQCVDYIRLAKGAVSLSKKMKRTFDLLNLGGGFGNFSEAEMTRMIEGVRKIIPKKAKLFFEAGRYLSQNAGFAIGHIKSVFRSSHNECIVLDLSGACHLQWSQPRVMGAGKTKMRSNSKVIFYGPTCFEKDIIGRYHLDFLNNSINLERSMGSPVLFSNVCGYSMARNHSFNGIQKARVHFIP